MEYHINNCHTIQQILTPDAYADYRVKTQQDSYERILDQAEDYCIEWIKRNNQLAIHIGSKRNANSVRIREEFYNRLCAIDFGGNVTIN